MGTEPGATFKSSRLSLLPSPEPYHCNCWREIFGVRGVAVGIPLEGSRPHPWLASVACLTLTFFSQGRVTLSNVSERKDNMRLGLSLTTNPKDNSFLVRTRMLLFLLLSFPFKTSVLVPVMLVRSLSFPHFSPALWDPPVA